MILGTGLPVKFGRCALVGSSADLKTRRLGKQIDHHDTVIRVNRVPIKAYYKDFGRRTDVLFTGPRAEGKATFGLGGQWYRSMGGRLTECPFDNASCPFTALVLKGSDRTEYNQTWEQRYPRRQPGWKPPRARYPIGYQSERVNAFAYQLVNGSRPTNGFHAFLTFALVCDSLRIYGFSGSETADAHPVRGDVHNLGLEHEIIQQLVEGNLSSRGGLEHIDRELLAHLSSRAKHIRLVKAQMRSTSAEPPRPLLHAG